jgi:hypothetical protein
VLVIRARDDVLEYARDGRLPYIPLFPLPDGRFVMVPLWDAYRFVLPASGPATHLVRERTPRSLRDPSGAPVRADRRPPRRFTDETAAPYVGTYYSDELDAFYRVERAGDALRLVNARHGALPLIDIGGDRFGVQGAGIAGAQFARAGERIVGLELEAVSWRTRASFRRIPSGP